MKHKIITLIALLLLPAMLTAGNKRLGALIKSHSSHAGVESKEFSGASLWAVKAMAPKGSMKGVEKITMLLFEDGANGQAYKKFCAEAEALFPQIGVESLKTEKDKNGEVKVYGAKADRIEEFVMFMEAEKSTMVMHLEGDIKAEK